MYSSILANTTLDLLKNRPRTLTIENIASDTGLTVGWLLDFAGERTRHPSVIRIEQLYNYLAKKPVCLV